MLDHGNKGISTMKTTSRKQYSREFKDQIVELFKLGKPVPQLAEEFGVGTSILYRLRREVSHLRLENDILKKAAVILGTQPHNKPAP